MCEFYHIPMLSKSAATQTEPGASAERVKILHIQHKDTNIQPCIRKPDLKRRQRVWVFLYRVILWCSVHAYLLTPMQKLPKTLFLNGILLNSKYCTAMLLTGRIFFLSFLPALFSTLAPKQEQGHLAKRRNNLAVLTWLLLKVPEIRCLRRRELSKKFY